ncbi:DUF3396 domain-containing protein [Cystobacter fuscus]|uniref:DUF3396 domain-containing protein n=1 Tax=Cystobacter fuscus TaxID=43 RepID=UPI0037C0C368
MMSEHYPRIRRYSLHDTARYLIVRECVSISFYVRRAHAELSRAVMHALEVYLRAVGPRALGLYGDDEGDWQELDDKGWEFIRQQFLNPLGARVALTGESDDLAGYEFVYDGRRVEDIDLGGSSLVTFFLPTEYLEEQGPGRVRELALELAAVLPFASGHAGLSFVYPEALLGVTTSIRDDAFRYPGLDMPDSYVAMDIGSRVKGAYWLTFLGQPLLGELGGVAGLRARLPSPGTTVQEMEGERAVVTLGEWPEAGDWEQGRTLSAYRELARVLEPCLYAFLHNWDGFSREDMRRWERRFLD